MRLNKKDIPFTMVANEVLYRADLSLRAKGLFAYLFSKPEGWEFAAVRIAKECKEERKSVLSVLRELEAAGLLVRKKLPNGKVEYTIEYSDSQSPIGAPRLFEPESALGTVPDRHRAEKGPVSNTENIIKKEEESNTDTPGTFARKFFAGDSNAVGGVMTELGKTNLPPAFIAREMLKFRNYWTEPSKNGKRERWELQQTFDVRRRLGTWFRNAAERSESTARRSGAGVTV